MAFPLPLMCIADSYLTRDHLQELFDDYMTAPHPKASNFSSLVNNIRQVYTVALLEVKDDLMRERMVHAQQITELQVQHKPEPVLLSEDSIEKLAQALKPALLARTEVRGVADVEAVKNEETIPTPTLPLIPSQVKQNTQSLAPETSTLYIGSNSFDGRRDIADWKSMQDEGGPTRWMQHLELKVFKHEEPGTIRIRVMQNSSPVRIWLIRDGELLDKEWEERLEFWAYENARPGTKTAWVGCKFHPSRCIFVKGDQKDKLDK